MTRRNDSLKNAKGAPQMTGGCAIQKKAIFVSVTDALAGKVPDVDSRTPLPDIARGFWRAKDSKIRQCELLVAVQKGIIRGVWEIDTNYGWHQMSVTAIPTRNVTPSSVDPRRKYCRVVKEVSPALKGKKLLAIGMRMYGPVRYNF